MRNNGKEHTKGDSQWQGGEERNERRKKNRVPGHLHMTLAQETDTEAECGNSGKRHGALLQPG